MDNRLGSLCPRQRRCGIGPTWGWTFCGEKAINDLELQAWGNNIRTLVKGLLSNSDYAAPGRVKRRLTQVNLATLSSFVHQPGLSPIQTGSH